MTIELIVFLSQRTYKLAQAPGQNSIGTGGQYWIGVNKLTQQAVQDVVIDTVVSGHGGDRHAGDSAGGH
jgi:hypothetical protein